MGHTRGPRGYRRCPAPQLWASEYLLMRSQCLFQHSAGAQRLRSPEKCHRLGMSLGRTKARQDSLSKNSLSLILHTTAWETLGLHSAVPFYRLLQDLKCASLLFSIFKCHLFQEVFPALSLPISQLNELLIPQIFLCGHGWIAGCSRAGGGPLPRRQ